MRTNVAPPPVHAGLVAALTRPAQLDTVAPPACHKEPSFYEAKAKQAQERVEVERKRRKISEVDPTMVFDKWQRAKQTLMDKHASVDATKQNMQLL